MERAVVEMMGYRTPDAEDEQQDYCYRGVWMDSPADLLEVEVGQQKKSTEFSEWGVVTGNSADSEAMFGGTGLRGMVC